MNEILEKKSNAILDALETKDKEKINSACQDFDYTIGEINRVSAQYIALAAEAKNLNDFVCLVIAKYNKKRAEKEEQEKAQEKKKK